MERIISVIALALVGCGSVSEAQPPTEARLDVTTIAVDAVDAPHTLSLTGTLAASQEADVAANVSGRVLETTFERGDFVARGTPLARVDVETVSLQAAEARAELEAARADDAQARLECGRSELLFAHRAISEGERDRDHARCEASAWKVRASEARVSRALRSVGDGIVRAPFDGMIAERRIAPGEYVQPATQIATMVDTSTLRLELAVPEADALTIAVGQVVRFTVAALPGEELAATVRYVGPSVRRDTRDVTIEAIVANEDGRLRPGMFAISEIDLGTTRAPSLPEDALQIVNDTAHVFVVAGGRVEERVVRTGPTIDGRIVILEGVAETDQVVAPITEGVRDGAAVETTGG